MIGRVFGLLALLSVVAIVIAVIWLWPDMPLRGQRSHDFGEVRIEGIARTVVHSLKFRNTSSQRLTIGSVKPTCSCVNAQIDRKEVESGEEVTLDLGMKLVESGRKDVTVNMVIEGHGVLSVTVTARGRRVQQISAGQQDLTLGRGEQLVTTVHGEIWPGDTTEPPTAQSPAGIDVLIEDWSEQKAANSVESRPAIYGGRLTIRIGHNAERGRHEVSLTGPGAAPLTMRIEVR